MKQADDKALEMYAVRIRARAMQRAGELLKTFDARPDNSKKQKDGPDLLLSRTEAAETAGMSERQRKTAVRLANIDKEEFESLVDSDEPPTLTELAQRGKK